MGIDQLSAAIAEGQRCGIATLRAEQVLDRLRSQKAMSEAAQAELSEALKGQGATGIDRIEIAIKSAKRAGVSAPLLQPAKERLRELEKHEKQCALVAGNLRRALPHVKQEPWKVQFIVDSAQKLQPWSPELEQLISKASEQLSRRVNDLKGQKEVQAELKGILKDLSEAPSLAASSSMPVAQNNAPISGDAALKRLIELVPRAKQLEVSDQVVREAEWQLKRLRREGCQQNVAEYRLKLALTARDLPEIKQTLRELRALSSRVVSTGERHAPQQSARLMDAASSMIRHLSDAEQKKQHAASALLALQQEAQDTGAPRRKEAKANAPTPNLGSSSGVALELEPGGRQDSLSPTLASREPAMASTQKGVVEPGSTAWVKSAHGMLREAAQSGVAPSLIEHARMKIRKKRRDCEERTKALEALQRAMSKKALQKHELERHLYKVRKFGAIVPASP